MTSLVPRRPPRWAGHVGATVLVLAAAVVPDRPGLKPTWSPEMLVFDALLAVVLLARHRAPRAVLVTVVGLSVLSVPLGLFNTGAAAATAVALFTLTLASTRRSLVPAVGLAALMVVLSLLAGHGGLQPILVIMLGGAIGDAVRIQRAHVATLTERAERAERTREALARQRVAEDRLAIARDLHDVVAHQIAVINLHAGLASSALPDRPEAADDSLGVIRDASRTVLTEIGDLLATLRDPDASSGPPGLGQLDDVLRGLAAAGLEVTRRTEGEVVSLPGTVEVTAFRVIQEALTNAHKHGADRRAHLLVEYLPDSLRITVSNPIDPGTAQGPGTGYGLIGAAERVESIRGTLHGGPVGLDHWELVATLPLTGRTPEETR